VNVSIIKSGNSLTAVFPGGRVFVADHTAKNWDTLVTAAKNRDWDELEAQFDILALVSKKSAGRAEIIGDLVYLDGVPVRNALSNKIVNMLHEGWTIDPMLRFLENVSKNPASYSQEELYLFLETNNLPITDDGCFLAYKVVREDYMDCYSGTNRNMIGDKPSMPREEVDPVRDRTCSRGLHFCSMGYIGHFTGNRVMILKINPADVVSIPSDYNNTKGRCWTYEVVDEVSKDSLPKYEASCPAVTDAYSESDYDDYEEDEARDEAYRLDYESKKDSSGVDFYEEYDLDPDSVTGNHLKELREALHITGSDLAQHLGRSRSAVWSFENSLKPTKDTVDRVLKALFELQNQ